MPQTRQRVVFTVPNPETTLVLGSRHWANVGYEGISGVTRGHILFKGTGPQSTVTIETPKQVMVHSTEHTLTAFAGDDMLLGSEKHLFISGRQRVYIGAGASGPQHPGVGIFDSPEPVQSVPIGQMGAQLAEVIGQSKEIYRVGTIAGAVVAAAGFLFGKQFALGSLLVGAVQLGIKSASLTLTPNYAGEVHVHGAGGAWLSAGDDANVVGLRSVNLFSPQFVSAVAGIQSSMTGLLAAGITGGVTASVTGFGMAEMLSGKKTSVTSRFGDVALTAKRISIGAGAPAFPQAATEMVEARATKGIDLSIGTVGPPKSVLHVDEEGVTATGKSVTLTTDKEISLAVGTFGLNAATDGISMTRSLAAVAKKLTDAANASYEATRTAADTAFDNLINSASASGAQTPLPAILTAFDLYRAQIKAAKAALEAQLKAARAAAAAVLRVAVTNRDAQLSNGLSKVSVDSAGRITIDAGAMPIVLKSGASSIEITPASIKVTSPSIVEG